MSNPNPQSIEIWKTASYPLEKTSVAKGYTDCRTPARLSVERKREYTTSRSGRKWERRKRGSCLGFRGIGRIAQRGTGKRQRTRKRFARDDQIEQEKTRMLMLPHRQKQKAAFSIIFV
ncbi:MAG: hypothetical protein OXM61_17220 [Candidatus Poribacteria bacterium]|nr:hypothetical protein [Candidatus Poribacteria bacterium]